MQLDKNNMKNIVERLYDGTKIFPSKVRDPKISLADMSGHNVVLYGLGECSHWLGYILQISFMDFHLHCVRAKRLS